VLQFVIQELMIDLLTNNGVILLMILLKAINPFRGSGNNDFIMPPV
jgi:hypothetical protein